jgi:vacuolar-type H+-ATPase catalytic subunit A/Vma1
MSQIAFAHLKSVIVLHPIKRSPYLQYNTRHYASNNFYIEYSKLTKTITSFVKSWVKVWNSIPTDVRELGRKKSI